MILQKKMAWVLAVIAICLIRSNSNAQPAPLPVPAMRLEDRVRIAEAMKISKAYGDRVWKGMRDVPFVIDLVTDSIEYLINHPSTPPGFRLLGSDSLLGAGVYYRKTVFPKNLLATFPAWDTVNTIVVGTPENTGKKSTDWIVTLLHEHFHQYTYSSPGYRAAVDSLGLSGVDKTGIWMLNYPFPYTDSTVDARYRAYISALVDCLRDRNTAPFRESFKEYAEARANLKKTPSPADYRYLSFQIWQEGIARYTEYKYLEMLDNYSVSAGITALPDYVPFGKYRKAFYESQLAQLRGLTLEKDKRVCFYAIGFAEGLILDAVNPTWRERYLTDRFYIERYSDMFAGGPK